MSIQNTLGRIVLLIVALLIVSWLSVPLLSVVLAEIRLLLWMCLFVATAYGWLIERAAPRLAEAPSELARERGR